MKETKPGWIQTQIEEVKREGTSYSKGATGSNTNPGTIPGTDEGIHSSDDENKMD